ncbi:hypothetical protein [Brevundimonas sp.]|uniref:hypothetical protein n=1 Tax=Brevundimonas sp. TaxID=1871086 RepID=UPI002D40BA4F|nr:hypothetical protein [Brevundimonas sp.]HYC68853.1 hypothetical protein [Brevundimonas sp.]
MANRTRRSGIWLVAVLIFLLTTLAQENLASLFEVSGVDRLWVHTGVVGKVVLWIWDIAGTPVATHIYAFVAGVMLAIFISVAGVSEGTRALEQGPTKPDMSIYDLVDYLTEETAWSKQKGYITDRMVEHELLDAFSSGRLLAFARKTDAYGSTSPQYRIDSRVSRLSESILTPFEAESRSLSG